jgi:lipopolysaccharide export system protein LptA
MLFLLACAPRSTEEPVGLLVAEEATVQLDGITISARQAIVDDDGTGRAEEVHAEAPPLIITSRDAVWSFPERSARFQGGVVATRADVTLRCDSLQVGFLRPDRIEHAVAEGSVVVTQGERTASGSRAELTAADGMLVLTGQPVITDAGNRLTGERITLWLDQERVECQGCTLVIDGAAIKPR